MRGRKEGHRKARKAAKESKKRPTQAIESLPFDTPTSSSERVLRDRQVMHRQNEGTDRQVDALGHDGFSRYNLRRPSQRCFAS